jgi:hypothetical protein
MEIIAGNDRALEDMHARRVVPHQEAMRRLHATVLRMTKQK